MISLPPFTAPVVTDPFIQVTGYGATGMRQFCAVVAMERQGRGRLCGRMARDGCWAVNGKTPVQQPASLSETPPVSVPTHPAVTGEMPSAAGSTM
jgi:hypothetical protein